MSVNLDSNIKNLRNLFTVKYILQENARDSGAEWNRTRGLSACDEGSWRD
jgi:hypothetical protein